MKVPRQLSSAIVGLMGGGIMLLCHAPTWAVFGVAWLAALNVSFADGANP
jgi:hypothetical protein